MKPPPFDYVAASSIEDVLEILGGARTARVLAGGQSLVPVLNLRLGAPEVLIDIGRVEPLQHLDITEGRLSVGAAVTQQQLLDDDRVREQWPLLAAALRKIGHTQIRNRGTVCGSLAHNDPQAELPAVALVLGAQMVARSSSGTRRVDAAEFFTGPFSTALADDELLVAVEFPAQPAGWAFEEFSNRPGDFAVAGVAVTIDRGRHDARVVAFGVGRGPVRAPRLEEALLTGGFETAIREVTADLIVTGDVHASSDARRVLLAGLLGAAGRDALARLESEDPR